MREKTRVWFCKSSRARQHGCGQHHDSVPSVKIQCPLEDLRKQFGKRYSRHIVTAFEEEAALFLMRPNVTENVADWGLTDKARVA